MKVTFVVFEDGWVCFQVDKMNERFRCKAHPGEEKQDFEASNRFCISSRSAGPDFSSTSGNLLLICGYDKSLDFFVPRKKFGSKEIAKEFVEKAKVALCELGKYLNRDIDTAIEIVEVLC